MDGSPRLLHRLSDEGVEIEPRERLRSGLHN
jgi:hypothetical protein